MQSGNSAWSAGPSGKDVIEMLSNSNNMGPTWVILYFLVAIFLKMKKQEQLTVIIYFL